MNTLNASDISALELLKKSFIKPPTQDNPNPPMFQQQQRQLVVGGDVKWKPVDKQAAMLLSKSPWWAHPPTVKAIPEPKQSEPVKRKEKTYMKQALVNVTNSQLNGEPKFGEFEVPVAKYDCNGQPLFRKEDLHAAIIQVIDGMPKETRPAVRDAEDARRVIDELLRGITDDMARFRSNTKAYLEEIRQTRYSVVTETAQISGQLREIRTFFMQSEYKEEIARLREFVDLCERLQKLKASGFLDSVADTMLRLAV